MSNYRRSTNPFEDEEDVDDETFLRNARRAPSPAAAHFDDRMQSFAERKRAIEERTISSTEKSIGILRDSEQVGVATAEELSRQREKLERTDKQLDEINATLRFSQKHINGIRSVFSSLRNYVAGRGEAAPRRPEPQAPAPAEAAPAARRDIFAEYDAHPSVRLRGLGGGGAQAEAGGSRDFSARLDANLSEMCSNISRLKNLASDMSVEIDSQNYLIDGITDKTEQADITIGRQNKDMNKILKK